MGESLPLSAARRRRPLPPWRPWPPSTGSLHLPLSCPLEEVSGTARKEPAGIRDMKCPKSSAGAIISQLQAWVSPAQWLMCFPQTLFQSSKTTPSITRESLTKRPSLTSDFLIARGHWTRPQHCHNQRCWAHPLQSLCKGRFLLKTKFKEKQNFPLILIV